MTLVRMQVGAHLFKQGHQGTLLKGEDASWRARNHNLNRLLWALQVLLKEAQVRLHTFGKVFMTPEQALFQMWNRDNVIDSLLGRLVNGMDT